MDLGSLLDSPVVAPPAPAMVAVHQHQPAPASSRSKPFGCTWSGCDRAFARKSDLVRHYRIHTGVKPFECPWARCDKRFIQRSALKVHYRTHSGERPHTCEVCERSFSDSSSLARHRRTHTGVRPYACDHPGCGKRFTRKTSLRKHAQTHDPNYVKRRRRQSSPISAQAGDCSLTASPETAPVSRQPSPSLGPESPMFSVSYLGSGMAQSIGKAPVYGQGMTSPVSYSLHAVHPTDSNASSSASTACNSPYLYGLESAAPLPPISALLPPTH